ncbi:MAG: matrixin family metalloprotease [Planctomycetota bacterium]|nr:matrixin family metalloprotease [Planctomycetota bacterium]
MRRRLAPRGIHALLPALMLLLAACGGGGGSDGPAAGAPPSTPTGLTITTETLPAGSENTPYAATQLQAANVQGLSVWSVASGSLPSGLTLDGNGMITGTPTEIGSFGFVARVDDEVTMATRNLLVAVDVLGITITSGLTVGDAWSGRAVTLAASGNAGSVTYSVVSNGSGGSFTAANPLAGTASWTPGPLSGAGAVDSLLAADTGSGQTFPIVISAMPNPADGHTAAFGSSDVWFLDPSPKEGDHDYATDFHHALATAGFRATDSTDATGTEADQLADLYVRIEILRQLNPMFLRNADGTAGAQGLAITFPLDEPGAGYTKAAPASSLLGSPTRYSVMGFVRGSQTGVIGTAFLDQSTNGWHENDTTSGSFELGVFTNQIVPIVNSSYSNALPANPVGAADIPALEALLYELPSPGGRFNTLRTQARGLARSLAAVIAHEIGHSLGLDHTDPSEPGSIMNPAASLSPSATYAFTSADITALQTGLPGAGKAGAALTALQATAPGPRPVEVCHCRACNAHGSR